MSRPTMLVVTATSRYLLTPPARGRPGTLTRQPGEGTPPAHDPDDWHVVDLRRDGETVEMLEVGRLEVGCPADFLIRLYPADQPALITLRQTTPVQTIEHLS